MSSQPQGRVFDPICGMWLSPDEVVLSTRYVGTLYAFCSRECFELFLRQPARHVVQLAYEPERAASHLCPARRGAYTASSSDPLDQARAVRFEAHASDHVGLVGKTRGR